MSDEAAGQVIAFIAGGAILVAALGAVLWATSTEPIDPSPSEDAIRESAAEDLIDVLVLQGTGWESHPDIVDGRLGLMGYDGLDLAKLELLRGALMASSPNGRLDYEDARASLLGPDAALDFHLRIYPAGLVRAIDQADLSHIRTAYIGDWAGLGTYTVSLGGEEAMVAAANAQINASIVLGTATERQVLTGLGLGFTDRVHITSGYPSVMVQVAPLVKVPLVTLAPAALLAGDVYPDHKQYLDNVLPGRLSQYDLLVIGSGVDQNTMTSNVVKDGIRDWVLAGGTMIVLGTDKQNYQWLRPIFDTGVDTVNGAPHAPDSSHPLLRVPHELNWPYYSNQGRAWDVDLADEDLFERVILVGDDEVLAVSKEGAFGAGRIFLTTYEPRHIASALGMAEASNLLDNIVVYADREHLYLDYGPPVPDGVAASSAVAQTWVIDDDIGFVPMRVEVLVW